MTKLEMINDIIYWKHEPKFGEWDKYKKRYQKTSKRKLKKIHKKLNKY